MAGCDVARILGANTSGTGLVSTLPNMSRSCTKNFSSFPTVHEDGGSPISRRHFSPKGSSKLDPEGKTDVEVYPRTRNGDPSIGFPLNHTAMSYRPSRNARYVIRYVWVLSSYFATPTNRLPNSASSRSWSFAALKPGLQATGSSHCSDAETCRNASSMALLVLSRTCTWNEPSSLTTNSLMPVPLATVCAADSTPNELTSGNGEPPSGSSLSTEMKTWYWPAMSSL
mmetsp:Transcript_20244/g.51112  ORF Transcript_20244/g.51112 Transcript_20244/m.51112 type:complete len:227 (+) Transcript_20244:1559-2239(+)